MKLKFLKNLGCISSDKNLELQETIQEIQTPQEIHLAKTQTRFSKFELINLKAAQEKQLQDISSTNHISITPGALQKQLSCLKKIDTKKNSVEPDALIKYHKAVEAKETPVLDVSISSESQNDQNSINNNLIGKWDAVDALLHEIQIFSQEVTQSAGIGIPGELNDIIISNDKKNVTVPLSPMSHSNIVDGSFSYVDNIPTESSTLLGNSSSDIPNINEDL